MFTRNPEITMLERIKAELNPHQQEAVLFNEGPSLVIAGAGSGKTRVLTYKIAYLLEQGLPAESILALTFTNKAAREMKDRIAQMVGWQTARRLYMGTFHSIFSRILRAEAELLGYTNTFTVYDSSDSKSLIKTILKELGWDDKAYKPSNVLGRISYAKNNLLSPQAYAQNSSLLQEDKMRKMPQLYELYKIYAFRCKTANAMDFDDLLFNTNVLFRDHPAILDKYKAFFQFILVDEYQDTNFSQYLIVKKLAESHQRLCVVGDDAQSIYSFRGANIDNILKFRQNYPDSKTFKLEQNYRSTQTIVNAANSLIEKNKEQIKKRVFSENATGNTIKVLSVYSDYDEGFTVANNIIELVSSNPSAEYQNTAIFYRTNSQSRILEEALRKRNIPYKIYGSTSFYQRKEIKDVLAYFRLIINENDEEALKRIINVPARGIGATTLNKIVQTAQEHSTSLWNVLCTPLEYNLSVNSGTAEKLKNFRLLIQHFSDIIASSNAYDIAANVIKVSGLAADVSGDTDSENMARRDNVNELLTAIHEFCELRQEEGNEAVFLGDFMSEVSLLTDQDTDKTDEQKNTVSMMTVHASKGLEFKHVFIVGMEEDLFPSGFSKDSERELEEERRLFYVAITRAEETCTISYAKSRFRNGQTNFTNPSRFIMDIDPKYLELPTDFTNKRTMSSTADLQKEVVENKLSRPNFRHAAANVNHYKNNPKPLTKIEVPSSDAPEITQVGELKVGAIVGHAIFGKGELIGLVGVANDARATVLFESVGEKNLLLKYAKLTVLG